MPKHSESAGAADRPSCRRVTVDPRGPVLVEGPVDVVLEDGTLARSDRFMVAICTCRRSRTYPWCDTSHRPREKHTADTTRGNPASTARAPLTALDNRAEQE
ncbi:CDGSH iron-sulfur domain-containing protein [Streptomyces sp. NPDC048489]|uniref:CDGSH iron-sulfur domain-containing protein n=1 Tax=Streptomyces sp. NPDC048489 TaxID=3154504 RepID=UPI00341F7F68